MKNKVAQKLIDMGICSEDSFIPYYPRVRDREDVSVLKCEKSGVIVLDSSDHMDISHYNKRDFFRYVGAQDRKTALSTGLEDAQRRFTQFKSMIEGKKWLDVGTGAGGILDLLSSFAQQTAAVEPQDNARKSLIELGYNIYPSVEAIEENDYEVVTLFHVLEHLTDPIGTLKTIKGKMAKGGKIVVEVPHAKDFLLSFLDNDKFKSFTFWSEHLILHTQESLEAFLKEAGFSNITIKGFQRYPLANHLYWLAQGKPGGHILWKELRNPELEKAYADMLSSINKTDTLIAIAEN
jgi:2-polyprenyl-3-methyl-5-hydroxy-6-metoxy-1,4-benzoquinol methylase